MPAVRPGLPGGLGAQLGILCDRHRTSQALKRPGLNLRDGLDCKASIGFAYALYEERGFTPGSTDTSGAYRMVLEDGRCRLRWRRMVGAMPVGGPSAQFPLPETGAGVEV